VVELAGNLVEPLGPDQIGDGCVGQVADPEGREFFLAAPVEVRVLVDVWGGEPGCARELQSSAESVGVDSMYVPVQFGDDGAVADQLIEAMQFLVVPRGFGQARVGLVVAGHGEVEAQFAADLFDGLEVLGRLVRRDDEGDVHDRPRPLFEAAQGRHDLVEAVDASDAAVGFRTSVERGGEAGDSVLVAGLEGAVGQQAVGEEQHVVLVADTAQDASPLRMAEELAAGEGVGGFGEGVDRLDDQIGVEVDDVRVPVGAEDAAGIAGAGGDPVDAGQFVLADGQGVVEHVAFDDGHGVSFDSEFGEHVVAGREREDDGLG